MGVGMDFDYFTNILSPARAIFSSAIAVNELDRSPRREGHAAFMGCCNRRIYASQSGL